MEEESSIISTAESSLRCPTGTDTVLVRVAAAGLWIIGHDQSAAIVIAICSGEFLVRVLSQSGSSLSMAVCMVGDHQWPLAIDTPVLKVGPRRFSFALPGFFLGLALPDSCTGSDLKLQGILMRFCAFEDVSLSGGGHDPNVSTAGVDFWPSLLPTIEKSRKRILGEKTPSQSEVTATAPLGNTNGTSNPAQKAILTSAVVKLVSHAFLRGAIDLNLHVQILRPTGGSKAGQVPRAFASVRAFTDVVDGVETAGRSIAGDARRGAAGLDSECWIFSKSGLTLLLRAVAAMAVVHVSRNSIAAAGAEVGGRAAESTSDSCLTGSKSNSVEKAVESRGL